MFSIYQGFIYLFCQCRDKENENREILFLFFWWSSIIYKVQQPSVGKTTWILHSEVFFYIYIYFSEVYFFPQEQFNLTLTQDMALYRHLTLSEELHNDGFPDIV